MHRRCDPSVQTDFFFFGKEAFKAIGDDECRACLLFSAMGAYLVDFFGKNVYNERINVAERSVGPCGSKMQLIPEKLC